MSGRYLEFHHGIFCSRLDVISAKTCRVIATYKRYHWPIAPRLKPAVFIRAYSTVGSHA